MPARVIKLTLEYDGTDYVGWQVQPNGPSIQAAVESALSQILATPVRVTGAGRTDSGVHARGQVASFVTERDLPLKAFVAGMNGLLPHDIAVVTAESCRPDFDARRSARGKTYRYTIANRRTRAPLRRRQAWIVFQRLDVEAMKAAALPLVGEHDFSAFRAADCPASTPVREIRLLDVNADGETLSIEVEGTAFLKHMVRNIVGTLVAAGGGDLQATDVPAILASKDRSTAGPTAPPQGLCLMSVSYPEGLVSERYP